MARATERQLVLFTAQSGVKVRQGLEKLASYCQRQGRPVQVLKVEDQLVPRHLQRYPDCEDTAFLQSPGGLKHLLLRPKEYLRRLWGDALKLTLDQAANGQGDILLAMNGIFYNNTSREFFSCVDMEALKTELDNQDRGLAVRGVVTLVDDIYDVYRWLAQPGQLFEPVARGPLGRAGEAILYMLMGLQWRAMETYCAAEMAKRFSVDHLVLAVKHPLSVVHDAIFTNKPVVYLSHPIADVRSDGPFIADVQRLTDLLRVSEVVVPIYPTSVDELRLEYEETAGGRVYRPTLTDRWPCPSPDESLFVPPPDHELNPLDPEGAFAALRYWERAEYSALAGLLRGLVDAIITQINWRDRKLVEQAAGIVAWRPFFSGNMSGGVKQEIAHRNSLVEYEVSPHGAKRCLVFAKSDDLVAYRAQSLIQAVRAEATVAGDLELPKEPLAQVKADMLESQELRDGFASGGVNPEAIQRVFNDRVPNISFRSIEEPSTLGPTVSVAIPREVARKWANIASRTQARDPLVGLFDDQVDEIHYDITIGEFVSSVEAAFRGSQGA